MYKKAAKIVLIIAIPVLVVGIMITAIEGLKLNVEGSVIEPIVVEKIPEIEISNHTFISEDMAQNLEEIVVNDEMVQEEVIVNINNVPMNRWGITLTEEEIMTLCQVLFLESGTESDYAQWATVSVIFNRMADPRFGSSLVEVLSAPNQFTTWSFRHRAIIREKELRNIAYVLYGFSSEHTDNMGYLFFGLGKGSASATKIDNQWFW